MTFRAMLLALSIMLLGTSFALSRALPDRPASADGAGSTESATRSRLLFIAMSKVIQGPRCLNCHPATRQPLQGDDSHPHVPVVSAAAQSAAFNCQTCHHGHNVDVFGGDVASIPGQAHWALAPASMAWVGKSHGQICRQLKDPARNGHRSLAALQRHMATDPLVGWAWRPGLGRTAAPGSQAGFGRLVAAWIASGAQCSA